MFPPGYFSTNTRLIQTSLYSISRSSKQSLDFTYFCKQFFFRLMQLENDSSICTTHSNSIHHIGSTFSKEISSCAYILQNEPLVSLRQYKVACPKVNMNKGFNGFNGRGNMAWNANAWKCSGLICLAENDIGVKPMLITMMVMKCTPCRCCHI